jgi:hypothetical protein
MNAREREADEREADALRRAEYDQLREGGPRGVSDLALRGAAQHAQTVGDGMTERRADDELERRGRA